MKCRIKITDTMQEAIIKMAEGNPGACVVLCELIRRGGEIDPDDGFGGFGKILSLDSYGIYGSRIWQLYKDVCGENLESTVGVLRAVQLGFINEKEVDHAISDSYEHKMDVAGLVERVKARLPKFGKAVAI